MSENSLGYLEKFLFDFCKSSGEGLIRRVVVETADGGGKGYALVVRISIEAKLYYFDF